MTKEDIIKACHIGTISYIKDTPNGLDYWFDKTGLFDTINSYIDYIREETEKYNLSFKGDTIYASIEQFDKLNNLRKELKKRFIVSPIQWTPIEYPEENYNTISFGIFPFVDISNGYKISDEISIDTDEEDEYNSADLSESEFWTILSKRIKLFADNKHIGRIFLSYNDDNNFIYTFFDKDSFICDLTGGADNYDENLSPRQFINNILNKYDLLKYDVPELKMVIVPNNIISTGEICCDCVRDMLMRCCVSNPIRLELIENDESIYAFSYDDEDYDYYYKHFSFFDKQFI